MYKPIKPEEIRKYDDMITLRINKKFYRLLSRYSKNVSSILRSIIRSEIYHAITEIFNTDIKKMFSIFDEDELQEIRKYSFKHKKEKFINVRLYKEEKELIKIKSKGNINHYVSIILMKFINKIQLAFENNNTEERIN